MTTPTIRFNAALRASKGHAILQLPEAASKKLPSRGQVAVQGTINGHTFRTVLEPDGNRGHWMNVDERLQRVAGVSADDTASVEVEPIKEWPEPSVPADLGRALSAAPRRSETSGRRLRRWRDGSGFGGSTRPRTLIPASGASR
ncbi:MAG TPA: DUF1905 domain-containing protein [Thermoanaerobaculia bacterium]|nr:DUF1905 domain-containing protein [Thermoanaerobaculia bacterium]